MKRFTRVPAPASWERDGLEPGRAWLHRHPAAERPDDLWSPHRPYLAAGFDHLCGYTAMWIPKGTVDHYIPWATLRGTEDEWRAYDWDNFRYSAGWFNSSRRGAVPDCGPARWTPEHHSPSTGSHDRA